MTSSITNAISAYRNAADPLAALGESSSSETGSADAGTGTDFASVLKDAAKVAIGGAKEAERASLSAVAGKADIREVVAAVANTELTLNTVVNIRDKVINAYTEILRMPI